MRPCGAPSYRALVDGRCLPTVWCRACGTNLVTRAPSPSVASLVCGTLRGFKNGLANHLARLLLIPPLAPKGKSRCVFQAFNLRGILEDSIKHGLARRLVAPCHSRNGTRSDPRHRQQIRLFFWRKKKGECMEAVRLRAHMAGVAVLADVDIVAAADEELGSNTGRNDAVWGNTWFGGIVAVVVLSRIPQTGRYLSMMPPSTICARESSPVLAAGGPPPHEYRKGTRLVDNAG